MSAIAALIALAVAPPKATIKELHAEKKGYWEIKVRYPRFSPETTLAKYVNPRASSDAKGKIASSKKLAAESTVDGRPRNPYSFEYDAEVDLETPQVVSFHYQDYSYTGGAHGNTVFEFFNYGLVGGKPKVLHLADISSQPAAVSALVISHLKVREGADWVQSGEVKSLTTAQLEQFVIRKQGLRFLFEPYAMGPYAAGSFSVDLDWSIVPGLKRTGPIATLLGS